MPKWIRLFTKVDSGDGIFRVKYESTRISEHREESLESKRAIRRINREDVRDNVGNTFLIVDYIDYFLNQ